MSPERSSRTETSRLMLLFGVVSPWFLFVWMRVSRERGIVSRQEEIEEEGIGVGIFMTAL